MSYVYFVSFSHEKGWGNTEVNSNCLLERVEDIQEMQREIQKTSGLKGVVVAGFQLIRTENS